VPSSRCALLHQVSCLYLKYNSQNSTYCSLYTAAHLCVMQSSSRVLKLAGEEVGKTKGEGGVRYADSSRSMAADIGVQCQSQIRTSAVTTLATGRVAVM
jgi:hypothetical protein